MILAGGLSARMGFDKQFLQIGSIGIIDGMAAKLSNLFDEILISTNKPEYYEDKDYVLLRDEIGVGPLSGIYSGLKFCKSDYLYVTACDMPFISIDYIRYMIELTGKKRFDACVARRPDGYYEPFNAIYNKNALKYIENAIINNDYGVNRILDKMNLNVIDAGTVAGFNNPNIFFNANHKEDLDVLFLHYNALL